MIQALRAPLTPVRSAMVIAVVALLGGVLGYLISSDRAPQASAPISPARTLAVGDVRLALPDGWVTPGAAAPRALALPGARTVIGTFTDVVVAQAPAAGPSLLPASLLRSLRPPPPVPITAGGLRAWSYAVALPGRGTPQAESDAVPTASGGGLPARRGPPSRPRAAEHGAGRRLRIGPARAAARRRAAAAPGPGRRPAQRPARRRVRAVGGAGRGTGAAGRRRDARRPRRRGAGARVGLPTHRPHARP